ncbi:hypothetical protein D3C71_1107880 [compost metagenome]
MEALTLGATHLVGETLIRLRVARVHQTEALELRGAASYKLGEGCAFQALGGERVRCTLLLNVVIEGVELVQQGNVHGDSTVVLRGLAAAYAQQRADELLLLQSVVLVPGKIGREHRAHALHVAQHGLQLRLDEIV